MNEKGLAVSVNMIRDNASINQNTDKPDLTTTTAVRLLLLPVEVSAEQLMTVRAAHGQGAAPEGTAVDRHIGQQS